MADQSGLNLSELPGILGFSKPSLFAYRAGKNRITPKVWLKLERAEREVRGKTQEAPPGGRIVESEANIKERMDQEVENFPSMVSEDEVPYRFTPMGQHCQGHEPAGESLLPVLERIAKALEMLVKNQERRSPKP